MEKRKRVIVQPSIQLKIISIIILVAILPIMALHEIFYHYTKRILSDIPAQNAPMLKLVESMQTLNMLSFLGFIILVLLLSLIVTLFLHKILGPVYRIEKEIDEMLRTNDFSHRLEIRKGDYLHSFTLLVNKLLARCK